MNYKNILFIINPISGNKNKKKIPNIIKKYINSDKMAYDIRFTEYVGHGKVITKENLTHFDMFAAVGGDGTVNEIASQLLYTAKPLVIIPAGSGNGLARHLGIPIDCKKAIQRIDTFQPICIDAGSINDHPFFCAAGIGFDAHISQLFMHQKMRGFTGYLYHAIKEFFSYQSKPYTLQTNESSWTENYFLITIANANQYGNNAYIAPKANIQDGWLDGCLIKPFPKWKGIKLGMQLFRKHIDRSLYTTMIRTKELLIEKKTTNDEWVHIDGETIKIPSSLTIKIIPQCLHVLSPTPHT